MSRRIWFYILGLTLVFACSKDKKMIAKYPSGKIKTVWYYQQDTLNGIKEGYYENGRPYYVLIYRNGKKNGEFRFFYDNGFISRSGIFKDDNLKGSYYKYYSTDSGRVMSEEYIMNHQGQHYYSYIKRYNQEGNLTEHERFLIVEMDHVSGKRNAIFKYVGMESYDSIKIVAGEFSDEFQPLNEAQLDTFNFVNDLAIIPISNLGVDSKNFIRGKFLGYKAIDKRGDSIAVKTWSQFYEQKLDDLNEINTEIKVYTDSLTSYRVR